MNKYAYKIYEAILSRPFRRDIVHKLYQVDENKLAGYFVDGFLYCKDIYEFINAAKFTPIKNLEIVGITEMDFRRVIRTATRHLLTLDAIGDVSDLSILSECEKLEKIRISSLSNTAVLPNTENLSNLKEVRLSLDAVEIKNTEGLISDSIEEFAIDACSRTGLALTDAKIEDFSFLLRMPNLKKLTLMVQPKENPYFDLVALSKLTSLRELKLPPDYFTKEEYAWLASKLPNTKGLDGCYCIRKDRQKDCIRYIMLGEHEDMILADDSRVEEYYKSFRAMVEEFKSWDTPPKRS